MPGTIVYLSYLFCRRDRGFMVVARALKNIQNSPGVGILRILWTFDIDYVCLNNSYVQLLATL